MRQLILLPRLLGLLGLLPSVSPACNCPGFETQGGKWVKVEETGTITDRSPTISREDFTASPTMTGELSDYFVIVDNMTTDTYELQVITE